MELHESLYALGLSQGRELFSDADSFRGALDDYLDEGDATTGEINLLVDAVRLGAFDALRAMLDSAADPARAVADAGARLARDRGSADVGGAMWALAALGYAIGKVPDDQVRAHRSGLGGTAPAAPAASAPPVMSPAPPVMSPGYHPAPPQVSPPVQPAVTSYGSVAPGRRAAPKAKKNRTVPILLGIVGLLVVAAIVMTLVATLGDKDGGNVADDNPSDTTDDSEGTETDVSFEAISDRYEGIANDVTAGTAASECVAAEAAAGEDERIECTVEAGTLTLVDYTDDAAIDAARTRTLSLNEGHLTGRLDSGYFYLFDPSNTDSDNADAELYWDSRASGQSAHLTGDNADKLLQAWRATGPKVDEPTTIASPDMQALADQFGVIECERIPTLADGETEEAECTRDNQPVWVGVFETKDEFDGYRNLARRISKADDFPVNTTWWDNGDASQTERGVIFGYTDDDGNGVLYFDDAECRCYVQAYDSGEGEPDKLWRSFFNVE